jgi:magnesium chelatase family protein
LSELTASHHSGESSARVRERVIKAREQALMRSGLPNAELSTRDLERDRALGPAERSWFERALERLRLSARAYHRVLKVARTIADLGDSTGCVHREHLAEALQLRRFDPSG